MDFLELLKLQKKNEQEKLTAHRKIYAASVHDQSRDQCMISHVISV